MSNAIKAIVCDFDGTFSTLRCGWEAVMKRMMLKYLPDEAWIDAFIGETTGVQTILQMKGFLEEVKRRGGSRYRATAADAQQRVPPEAGAINCAPPDDPWFYKNEYNGMLMASVAVKRDEVLAGKASATTYHVPGAILFLQALKTRGVKIYFASGTDQADVRAEAAALRVRRLYPHRYRRGVEAQRPARLVHGIRPHELVEPFLREPHFGELLVDLGKLRLARHLPRIGPAAEPPRLWFEKNPLDELLCRRNVMHGLEQECLEYRHALCRRTPHAFPLRVLESLRLDDGLADCDEEPGLGPQFADLLLHEGECPLHESAP